MDTLKKNVISNRNRSIRVRINFNLQTTIIVVNEMLNNLKRKNKCADIESSDQYSTLLNGVTNPYCYNFGKIIKNGCSKDFMKLQHEVNTDFFYKK